MLGMSMLGGTEILGNRPTKEVLDQVTGNSDLCHVAKSDEWGGHLPEAEFLSVPSELVCRVECLGADLTG
jgi:hypothetical protein